MKYSTRSFLNLYQFPTGRRLLCLGRVREALCSEEFEDLRARIEQAVAADWATRGLEARWRGSQSQGEHAPEARVLHAKLSRCLSALDEALGARQKGLEGDSPEGRSAAWVRAELFPEGVRNVTNSTYVEQHIAVTLLLRRLASDPELAKEVRHFAVQSLVDRLAELNVSFGRALQVQDRSVPSFQEVLEARQAGQEALSQIVVQIVALLNDGGDGGKAGEALTDALTVVLEQNAAIKRHRRRRRNVTDVDPETGAEFEAEDGLEDGEASAASPEGGEPPGGVGEVAWPPVNSTQDASTDAA